MILLRLVYYKCTALFLRFASGNDSTQGQPVENGESVVVVPGFMSDFTVIFNFSTQIKMLRKSKFGNVFDGVYFSKVARLQLTDCNFTMSRLLQKLSSQYAPKTSLLKNDTSRKISTAECFNKVAAL